MKFVTHKKIYILFIACFLCFINASWAKNITKKKVKTVNKSAELVIDSRNYNILYAKHANEKRYPASLTKMMTLYIAFEKIKYGNLRLKDELHTSLKAARTPYGSVGLKAGNLISAENAILALIIRSSNSAAIVLAESISGSEEKFAELMNKRAKQLGMNNTHFVNASGLPDLLQYTTAIDMAKLAIALKRDFPEFYDLFKKTNFVFKGKKFFTTNTITKLYPYADGLKTGYTNASGYNLVTSASNQNKHLIAVVMGGETSLKRDYRMVELLDKHLGIKYNTHKMLIVKNSKNNNKIRLVEKKNNKRTLINKNKNIKLVRNK